MYKIIAVLLSMAVPLLWVPAVFGKDKQESISVVEPAKKRTDLERQLLYREIESLARSQEYIQSVVCALEKQIDAIGILDSSKREKDIESFLDWYRSYAEWLGSNRTDIEADLSKSYTDGGVAIVQPHRFYALADGYVRLGTQLEAQISHLDKLNDKTLQQIVGLKLVLEYVTSVVFIEERNREKKQAPQGYEQHKDERYERYKNITDIEIALMQRELKSVEEMQKHFFVLLEMGRMELAWISRKTGDYGALCRLTEVVGKDAPGPIEEASNRVIQQYDADRAYFKRKVDDIARARSRVVPTGSLRTLDRMEELVEKYDLMKNRYDRHLLWLADQAGAYRADIVELQRDK